MDSGKLTPEEQKFATHLSISVIERVHAEAFRYCRKFDAFGYDWQDVAQQTVETLLKQCQAGKLYAKVTRRYILNKIQDSIRSLQGGRTSKKIYAYTLEQLEQLYKGDSPEGDLGADQVISGLEAGLPLADLIRDHYDASGSLWTRDFHIWLDTLLKNLQEESARIIHTSTLNRDTVLIDSEGRVASGNKAEDKLTKWVIANSGQCSRQLDIAKEIGITRETVARVMKKMVVAGKIERLEKCTDCSRHLKMGQYSYRLVASSEGP